MVKEKNSILVFLVAFRLAIPFSALVPTVRSPGAGGYDSWLDVNDDGQINIIDVTVVAKDYLKTA
jgi:hypothetical protein